MRFSSPYREEPAVERPAPVSWWGRWKCRHGYHDDYYLRDDLTRPRDSYMNMDLVMQHVDGRRTYTEVTVIPTIVECSRCRRHQQADRRLYNGIREEDCGSLDY